MLMVQEKNYNPSHIYSDFEGYGGGSLLSAMYLYALPHTSNEIWTSTPLTLAGFMLNGLLWFFIFLDWLSD